MDSYLLFISAAEGGGGKKKGKSSAFQTISATHRVSIGGTAITHSAHAHTVRDYSKTSYKLCGT